jgi:hypothetical protein
MPQSPPDNVDVDYCVPVAAMGALLRTQRAESARPSVPARITAGIAAGLLKPLNIPDLLAFSATPIALDVGMLADRGDVPRATEWTPGWK